jgi:hypothetical protein
MVVTQTSPSHEAAPAFVFRREPSKEVPMTDAITIRAATFADRPQIERLAALDEGRAPFDDYLLAFVDGELRAALPRTGGRPLADPFHLTGEVVSLLRFWAAHQEEDQRSRPRQGRHIRLRPGTAGAAA